MNVNTVEVNVTTKDRHYLVVKVNCSDVHYHRVVNVNTVEVNVTTKDRHYLVVKVNCSDVHYHIVVNVNTFYFTFLCSY